MNSNQLKLFFFLELAAAVLATVSFATIPWRTVAAMVAGGGFVLLGGFILFQIWSWPRRARSLTFWAAHVHLFVGSLPLLLTRLLSKDFSQAHILGLPSGAFHRVSETIYLLLVIATIADWIRSRKN